MSRLHKTEKIIRLALLLENSYCGLTLDEMAEHFECSRRSAERMKALLFDMFPGKIEEVPTADKKKRWRFIKGAMKFLVSFTKDELANLELLKQHTNDRERERLIDELVMKIKALTPQANLRAIDTDITAILETEGLAVRQHSRNTASVLILEKVREAILSFKKVQFKYLMDGEVKEITLDPYGIKIADKYYLIGYNDYKKDIRQYSLSKILSLSILDEYFEVAENFNLRQYCDESFGVYQEKPINVTIELDKSVADDAKNYHFHPTQKIKTLKNGNISVKFTSGGTKAMCHEFFKWGAFLKIKAPEELKNIYQNYLLETLNGIETRKAKFKPVDTIVDLYTRLSILEQGSKAILENADDKARWQELKKFIDTQTKELNRIVDKQVGAIL